MAHGSTTTAALFEKAYLDEKDEQLRIEDNNMDAQVSDQQLDELKSSKSISVANKSSQHLEEQQPEQ